MSENIHRYEITFSSGKDVAEFVSITNSLSGDITLHDMRGHVVDARSLMGCLYTLEYDKIICVSEQDIFFDIRKFIVE